MTHIVTNIILKGDRVLVGRYSERNPKEYLRGLYTGPGGGVELGETQWDAAAREIREETGTDAGLTPYGMRLFEALPAGQPLGPGVVEVALHRALIEPARGREAVEPERDQLVERRRDRGG